MSIKRHTAYNLLGAGTPVLVSLATVPLYLHLIGDARYGVLAIVWLLLGYFGFFDLGLSLATTNHIARLNEASVEEREGVFWTALTLNGALGVVGGLVLYGVARPLMTYVFTMPSDLRIEVLAALPFIAAAIPVATMTGVFSGALGARQRFGTMNIIQSTGTVIFQVAPLVAAYIYGPNLLMLIGVAVVARMITALPFLAAVKVALPLRHRPRFDKARVRELMRYGAWVTVTNLISPLLTAADRFIIAAVSGAAAVTYYNVPYNLAIRAAILPAALSSAIFPRLSMTGKDDAKMLTINALETVNVIMTPVIIAGIFLMRPFLELWVGIPFALQAAPVGAIILVGVWGNGLSFMPLIMLEGQGRPDLVAKLHAIELVPYAALLWFSLTLYGLPGAALAWTGQVFVDTLLLCLIAGVGFRFLLLSLLPSALLVSLACVVVTQTQSNMIFSLLWASILVFFSLFASYQSSAVVRQSLMSVSRRFSYKIKTAGEE
ncbi:flippase [Acidithiobacillus ferrianus]|uniref:Oligosaccharide flippase family protein n=2 Tax=Acidithiobacillus ferrianus TaxID=2678518 RepID=A0A845U815_9PROT|nr:flippase [Acidithiobacillus ferrianus]NDU41897.1 oligosaccharide flippase family protein [Acidithiobacillus ferrianus]